MWHIVELWSQGWSCGLKGKLESVWKRNLLRLNKYAETSFVLCQEVPDLKKFKGGRMGGGGGVCVQCEGSSTCFLIPVLILPQASTVGQCWATDTVLGWFLPWPSYVCSYILNLSYRCQITKIPILLLAAHSAIVNEELLPHWLWLSAQQAWLLLVHQWQGEGRGQDMRCQKTGSHDCDVYVTFRPGYRLVFEALNGAEST